MHRIATHLRGNFVAYVAIFLALGGTAVAAKKIGTRWTLSWWTRPGR